MTGNVLEAEKRDRDYPGPALVRFGACVLGAGTLVLTTG